jgi:hypothetical protein
LRVSEPTPARHVDDAGCRRLAQQRQHRLGNGKHAEHIGFPDRSQLIEGYIAWTRQLGVVLDGLTWPLARIRDGSVVDEHVETAKLVADALCGVGDRSLVRHVELEHACVRPDLAGRGLTALEIARPD